MSPQSDLPMLVMPQADFDRSLVGTGKWMANDWKIEGEYNWAVALRDKKDAVKVEARGAIPLTLFG